MSLMNRRGEYRWPKTGLSALSIESEKKTYSIDDVVALSFRFRVVGGLRESFIPDVWTVAWEDNDKMVRLTMESVLQRGRSVTGKKIATTGKEVRRAKFYWSRDPDLPYRIWTAIIHEDGSAPIIPRDVDDAKSEFLDITKRFELPASGLGRGRHEVSGTASVSWGRRSYLEKGSTSSSSKPLLLEIE